MQRNLVHEMESATEVGPPFGEIIEGGGEALDNLGHRPKPSDTAVSYIVGGRHQI